MTKNKNVETTCRICNRKFETLRGLGVHITRLHKISIKQYYDTFLRKKEEEEKCLFCEKKTNFMGLRDGYHTFCSPKCFVMYCVKNGIWHGFKCGDDNILRKSKKAKENHKKAMNKYIKDNPGDAKERASKGGRIAHEKNKEFFKEMNRRVNKKYGWKHTFALHPKESREWILKGAKKGLEVVLSNGRHYYKEIPFMSKDEVECYKFLEKMNISFIYNYKVSTKFIDFFIENKFFWEHHPIFVLQGETIDQYYQRRRELLDSNGYQDYKLIVTTSLKEMDIIEREINDQKRNHPQTHIPTN